MKDLKHLKRKADKILYQTLPSDMVKDIRDQKLVGQYFHRDIFNAVLGYRLENCKKDHMIIECSLASKIGLAKIDSSIA